MNPVVYVLVSWDGGFDEVEGVFSSAEKAQDHVGWKKKWAFHREQDGQPVWEVEHRGYGYVIKGWKVDS